MAKYNYSTKVKENFGKAVGRSLDISTKHSVEVCSFIRGKTLQNAKKLLNEVIGKKRAVPYKRYKRELPHRPGMASGRYPVKTCMGILNILKSAEANAQFKGLGVNDLVIRHISAQRGPTTRHFGRRRTMSKRTHLEVVVEEIKKK